MPAPARLATPRIRPATRFVAAAVLILLLSLAVAACGGDSSSASTSTAGQQGNARGALFQDPKVQACLKKQGVTGPRWRPAPKWPPPTGTNGQPPGPPGGTRRNSAQVQKLRKALQKCGVTLPARGPNAPPQDATPAETTAS
jgi:hypothetical protein